MIEKLKNAFQSLGEKIGVSGKTVGFGVLAVLVLLLAIVIIAIVSHAKKNKKTNEPAAAETEEKAAEQEEISQPTEEEKTVENEEQNVEKIEENTAVLEEKQPEIEQKTPEIEDKTEEKTEKTEEIDMKNTQKSPENAEKTAKKQPKKAPAAQAAKQPAKQTAKQPAKAAKPEAKPEPKRMLGKWRIIVKGENAYIAALYASNGEVMLTSEIYSTEDGARSGVDTIRRGAETGNFVIYRDKGGDYYFKLKSSGNRLLCVGEIYKTKDACEKAAESVKRIAKDSPLLIRVTEGERFITYTPAQVTPPPKKSQGKWRIEEGENGGFSAKLYANNGQIMLSTEEVASRKTAEKAIESVRKNCAAGNFYIDKDKFGRFYYKLHNVQKSVICTGETYDKVDAVVSAIESVRRFASNAELAE